MNYQLPQSNKDKIWEERYQQIVSNALKQAPKSPVLVAPRKRLRGWSWLTIKHE